MRLRIASIGPLLLTVALGFGLTVAPTAAAHANLLDRAVSWFTSSVRVQGLGIHWGGTLTATKLELRDQHGTYATLDKFRLVWSPLRFLLHRVLIVDSLTANGGEIARLPAFSSGGGSSLPGKIDIKKIALDKLAIAKPVAGLAMELNVAGFGRRTAPDEQQGTLTAEQVNGGGRYAVAANLTPAELTLDASAEEKSGGLIAQAAGLPDLGAIHLAASATGPRDGLKTKLVLAAGKLQADIHGQVNLTKQTLALDVAASAPSMQPRTDLSWQALALAAQVHGSFASPDVNGAVRIEDVFASGARARMVALGVLGNKGAIGIAGTIDGVVVPGKQPDLFSGAPIQLVANTKLADPAMPMTFSVRHPILDASGTVLLASRQGGLLLRLPELKPFAAEAGMALAGQATILLAGGEQSGMLRLGMHAALGVSSGPQDVTAVLGDNATLNLAAQVEGRSVRISTLSLDGQNVSLSAHGLLSEPAVDLTLAAGLRRLAPLDQRLAGHLQAEGRISGASSDLNAIIRLSGLVAVHGTPSGPFTAEIAAQGLPHDPRATITAEGALLNAPIRLAASGGRRPDGSINVTVSQADWKSARAHGALTIPPGSVLPQGQIALTVAQLADFGALIGKPLHGSIEAALQATADRAVLTAQASDAGLTGTGSISKVDLQATVGSLTDHPVVNGRLALGGVSAGKLRGSVQLSAQGPETAIAVRLAGDAADLDGAPGRIVTAGVLDVPAQTLLLDSIQGRWKGKDLYLLSPVRLVMAQGIDIEHLRLSLAGAVIEANGHIGSSLDFAASARNVPANLVALMSPGLNASGTLSAEARLSGTATAPRGLIRAQGNGLKVEVKDTNGLPPASFTASADLHGESAAIAARATAGNSYITVNGRAPLSMTGPLDLHAQGIVDLALAAPLLAAKSDAVAGRVSLAANIGGTPAKPDGTVRVEAASLRVTAGPGAGLPPASLIAVANLTAGRARIDARLRAGASHIALAGTAVLAPAGALDLRAVGTVDLAITEPLLAASGGAVHGTLQVDARVTGTAASPRLGGGATLLNGDFRDYARGVHLSDIAARVIAVGETLRLASLTAKAGSGSVAGSGTIGVFAPGIPVNLRIIARDATPISGDVLTVHFNADLSVTGTSHQIVLGGGVNIRQAVIQIPERLPTSVKTIPVRIAGAPPPAPKPPSRVAAVIAMNLTISAPEQVFIRGRGLNVELGGTIRIAGTTAKMLPSGGFKLICGSLNLVGNTLTFTKGAIDFNGGSLTNPEIDLEATAIASNITAQLVVGGTAQAPTVTLTSTPPLPQDEILATLLFRTNAGSLSPFQLASIAAGLAELTGTGGGFANPLAGVRNTLGLDQLGIGYWPERIADLAGRPVSDPPNLCRSAAISRRLRRAGHGAGRYR